MLLTNDVLCVFNWFDGLHARHLMYRLHEESCATKGAAGMVPMALATHNIPLGHLRWATH
jgi:hypothetical protein